MTNRHYHTSSKSVVETKGFLSKILTHPFVIGLWIVVAILASVQLIYSALSSRQVLEEKARQEALLKKEEERGLEIIEKIENANTDFAKEKIIRDELHMQKPGETILSLPATPSPSP